MGNWDLLEKMAMPRGGIIKTVDEGEGDTGRHQVVVPSSKESMTVNRGGSVAPQGVSKPFLCLRLFQIWDKSTGMMSLHGKSYRIGKIK